MAIFDLTLDNVEQAIQENEILLLDFWADWCDPCKQFSPIFEKVSENHPDIGFAKVDTDNQQTLAAQFGIQSIPTVGVFREGILIFLQPGALEESQLEELIKQVRQLDMDEVRQKVEEAEQAEQEEAANQA